MKRLFLVLAALLLVGGVSAQSYRSSSKSANLHTGYHGFVDMGYTVGVGDWGEGNGRLQVTTTHGYQFNPYFFLGGGMGFSYFDNTEVLGIPMYAAVVGNFKPGKITPFVSMRLGYTVITDSYVDGGSDGGIYCNPSIGVRFATKSRVGVSFAIGYEVQKDNLYDLNYGEKVGTANVGGVSFKVGIDF